MSINKTLFIQDEKVWKYNGLMQADTVDYEKNGIQRYATVESWTVARLMTVWMVCTVLSITGRN